MQRSNNQELQPTTINNNASTMRNQWTSSLHHQWGFNSHPDDPVKAYVHSSKSDTNTDLTNHINHNTVLSSNEVNYSVVNQSCIVVCLWNAKSIVN